jgi:hypothetical protein
MKFYAFLLTMFITTQLSALHDPNGYYEFETTRKDWTYSTTFEMDSHARAYGTVEKSSFHVRTNYDLYDDNGDYKAKGIARFFSWGRIWTWATVIDVYDEHGHWIGLIDGEIFTVEPAKFAFYDANSKHIATAYLDAEGTSFSIVPSYSDHLTVADITRIESHHSSAVWRTDVHIPFEVDIRLMMIFSAFVVDRQNAFYQGHPH